MDLGIERDVATGMKKIISIGDNPNSDIDNKLIFLSWILRLYKDVKKNRIEALHVLRRGIELSASKLEQKEMQNIIFRLQRIDDESLIKEGSYILRESVLDDVYNSLKKSTKKMKSEGISRYDDEYYEFEFRLNNLENSDDALLMVHQINSRMAVIRDLLDTEDIDKSTKAKWEELYNRYDKLRAKISQSLQISILSLQTSIDSLSLLTSIRILLNFLLEISSCSLKLLLLCCKSILNILTLLL
jgi:hypothetical protein